MSDFKNYKNKSGRKIKAKEFHLGMEDGICKKHNKPYLNIDGNKSYIAEGDYIFIDGEGKTRVLMKELFEKECKEDNE